jgi:hypothetical protein
MFVRPFLFLYCRSVSVLFGQLDAFPVMPDLTRVPVQSDGLGGCKFISVDGRGCLPAQQCSIPHCTISMIPKALFGVVLSM